MDITVQKLNEMRKSDDPHMLLDIREDQEVAICSIDGSTHIPMNEIPERLDELPRDKTLVVMCHVGGRSFQVTQWLLSNGFDNALNLEGGIAAWSQEIDRSVPTY